MVSLCIVFEVFNSNNNFVIPVILVMDDISRYRIQYDIFILDMIFLFLLYVSSVTECTFCRPVDSRVGSVKVCWWNES